MEYMIHFIIADDNKEYVDLFTKYMLTTKYTHQFVIKSFTSKENVERFILSGVSDYILLVAPLLIPNEKLLGEAGTVFILSDSSKSLIDSLYPILFKYQPLNQLISQMMSIYLDNNDYLPVGNGGKSKTKVLTVFSASGGSGKTTLAVNLSKELALRDYNIFYLNLEYFHSMETFFPINGDNGFAEILYYLKAYPKQITTKIEALKKQHTSFKVDYFEPSTNHTEVGEMSKEETELLISGFIEMGIYDFIVIDLDSSIHERNIGALHNSDYILWLLLDDIQSMNKNKQFLQQYRRILAESYNEFSEKLKFIVNKYLGDSLVNDWKSLDIHINGYLPYVPQWKAVSNREQLLNQREFNEEMMKSINALILEQ